MSTLIQLSATGTSTNSANKLQHNVKYGEAINKGQAVYVSSATGTNIIVSKADYSTEGTSSKTMGLVLATGALNYQGIVVTEGLPHVCHKLFFSEKISVVWQRLLPL